VNTQLKEIIRRSFPRGLHSFPVLQGPLKGARIVTSLHDYPAAIFGTTERPLVDWISRNAQRGETWLDVGAHYGYTAIAFARAVGRRGRVFAFEPVIATAGCISRTRTLNQLQQIKVVPLALGSDSGIRLDTLATVRGMVDRTVNTTDVESFLVTSLDWLWDKIAGEDRKIDGIKIDVQGGETLALRGMTTILSTWKPKLAIEFHEGVNRVAILEILRSAGYRSPPSEISTGNSVEDGRILDNVSYAFD
jgi:FkbM family methyltransferase